MIRTTMNGNPKRRIAVIRIPRPQASRLGVIRVGQPRPAVTWTTVTDEVPDSSANWMSNVLAQQQYARTTTPGTLTYTPANNTPAPNVAPWNSWLQPNCAPAASSAAFDPTATGMTAIAGGAAAGAPSKIWLFLGLLGAAASVKYLVRGGR
jgi:hypothetical protein